MIHFTVHPVGGSTGTAGTLTVDNLNLVVLEGFIPDKASDDGDGVAGRDPGRERLPTYLNG